MSIKVIVNKGLGAIKHVDRKEIGHMNYEQTKKGRNE